MLSNVIDNATGCTPEHVQEYHIIERAGVRIGVIGLIEKYVINASSHHFYVLTPFPYFCLLGKRMDWNHLIVAAKFRIPGHDTDWY